MIEEKYMREFAHLNDVIYLDVATVGIQPAGTLDFCSGFQREFARNYGRSCLGEYEARRAHAAETMGELFNAPSENIMFLANATEGNNLLVNCLNLKKGDSVICAEGEFPAVLFGWIQKQRDGIELRAVKAENGVVDADDVIAAIDETTRAVMLSFVQYMSGFKADLEKIGAECAKRGIFLLVDATQGAGRNVIDVQKMHIDFLVSSGFKALLGVFGAAVAYFSDRLLDNLISDRYCDSSIDAAIQDMNGSIPMQLPYKKGINKLEGGSKDTYSILALEKSVELLLEIGIPEIQEEIACLESSYRRTLKEKNANVQMLGSKDPARWSGNICTRYDISRTEALRAAFEKNRIYAMMRNGILRVSLHCYNTEEQVIKAAEVISETLAL